MSWPHPLQREREENEKTKLKADNNKQRREKILKYKNQQAKRNNILPFVHFMLVCLCFLWCSGKMDWEQKCYYYCCTPALCPLAQNGDWPVSQTLLFTLGDFLACASRFGSSDASIETYRQIGSRDRPRVHSSRSKLPHQKPISRRYTTPSLGHGRCRGRENTVRISQKSFPSDIKQLD